MSPGDGTPGDDAVSGGDVSEESASEVPASDGSASPASEYDSPASNASGPDDPSGGGGPPDSPAGTESGETSAAAGPTANSRGRREVEVPQSLYRIVTVFSTLLSILLVVAGFTVLTMATTVLENPPASLAVQVLGLVVPIGTLVDHRTTLALGVGLLGLVLIAGGAGVFVYGSRFRAPGMGKSKDGSDEDSNDG